MKRALFLLAFALLAITTRSQVSVGTRDNQYFYGAYQYKGWNVKLEQSVYAEKIGFQYLRLYAGYSLQGKVWSVTAEPYFGISYNADYHSTGCLLTGRCCFADRYHVKLIYNPHYDSAYEFEHNFKVGAGMDISQHIGIMAEYQEMPIFRMKEKRLKGGLIFRTGNLSASPQLSVPMEGAKDNIRCLVDFRYCFNK